MKCAVTLFCLLIILSISTAIPASKDAFSQRARVNDDLCDGERLKNLAACGCFVEATYPEAPEEELQVCQKLFGEDLLILKPYCKDFMDAKNIDVDALSKAIEEVREKCFSNGMKSSGSKQMIETLELEYISERIVPILVAAAILLYSTPAY